MLYLYYNCCYPTTHKPSYFSVITAPFDPLYILSFAAISSVYQNVHFVNNENVAFEPEG